MRAVQPCDDDARSTANARATRRRRCSIRGCGYGRRHRNTRGGVTTRRRKTIVVVEADGAVDSQALATGPEPAVASVAAARVHSKGKGGLPQRPLGNNTRPQRDREKNHHLLLGTERHRAQRAPFPRPRPRLRHLPPCIRRCCRFQSPGSEPGRWSAAARYYARVFRAPAPSPRRGAAGGVARDHPRAR